MHKLFDTTYLPGELFVVVLLRHNVPAGEQRRHGFLHDIEWCRGIGARIGGPS